MGNPKVFHWTASRHYDSMSDESLARYRIAAELGWESAQIELGDLCYERSSSFRDLQEAVHWGSVLGCAYFWWSLGSTAEYWDDEDEACVGFQQLAMEIGKGLYWYQYDSERFSQEGELKQAFGSKCLDYYCETIELQQEAIFLFLLFWNKTTGVKDVGQTIGEMAWEGRYKFLVKEFGEE